DSPLIAPHTPTAWARALGSVNVLVMIARLAGVINALPNPCTARNPTNAPSDGANPQANEDAINTAIPQPKSRRRPNRSPSEPHRNSTLARTSTYASTVHCRPDSEEPRPRCSDGSATLRIVLSSVVMNNAMQQITSVSHSRCRVIVRCSVATITSVPDASAR